jgi:hypothetical protein
MACPRKKPGTSIENRTIHFQRDFQRIKNIKLLVVLKSRIALILENDLQSRKQI